MYTIEMLLKNQHNCDIVVLVQRHKTGTRIHYY